MVVRQGQVLARLDDGTLRATLALAQAQVDAARRGVRENEVRQHEANLTLARVKLLTAEGVSTQAELEAAQAQADSFAARIEAAREQVRVAEQQAALAKTSLDDTVIRRLAAWLFPRTHNRAKPCLLSRQAAASPGPASAPSSTCSRSRSKST